MELKIYTDGGARGNPGISGYGFVVLDQDNKLIFQDSKFLGIKTNNEAEYMGLVAALTWLSDNLSDINPSSLHFYSDSQLMVRQVQGIYKVKSPHLRGLHQSVISLLSAIRLPYKLYDIRRELNSQADALANQAMDEQKL